MQRGRNGFSDEEIQARAKQVTGSLVDKPLRSSLREDDGDELNLMQRHSQKKQKKDDGRLLAGRASVTGSGQASSSEGPLIQQQEPQS